MSHLAAWLRKSSVRTFASWFPRLGHARVLRSGQAHTGAVTVLGGPYPGRSPALTKLVRQNLAATLADAGLRPDFPAMQANPWRGMLPGEETVVVVLHPRRGDAGPGSGGLDQRLLAVADGSLAADDAVADVVRAVRSHHV